MSHTSNCTISGVILRYKRLCKLHLQQCPTRTKVARQWDIVFAPLGVDLSNDTPHAAVLGGYQFLW